MGKFKVGDRVKVARLCQLDGTPANFEEVDEDFVKLLGCYGSIKHIYDAPAAGQFPYLVQFEGIWADDEDDDGELIRHCRTESFMEAELELVTCTIKHIVDRFLLGDYDEEAFKCRIAAYNQDDA